MNMKLEIKNLKKVYGNNKAINDLTLNIDTGIYGLLGPNGAGKSTLFHILVKNVKPTGGQIDVNGNPIDKKYNSISVKNRIYAAAAANV